MSIKNKTRMLKKEINFKSMYILISLCLSFFISVSFVNSLALEITPYNPNLFEDEILTLNISLQNVNGTSIFEKNVTFGEIVKINESFAQFIWEIDPSLIENKTNIFSVLFNASDNGTSISKNVSITVTKRNNPPIILNATIGGIIYEPRLDLFLEVDRESICKYSFSNKTYNLMEYTFNANEDKRLHNATSQKLSQGTKTVYVLCRDFSENYMEEPYVITFDINLPPTVSIYLDPTPPLKSERVYVELVASEDLADAPELSYTFDDDQTPKLIALVGSGRKWEGYMIIRGQNIERVGSFSFKGIDLTGIEGTQITQGKLFLIDTNKPGPIQSIEVTNQYDRTRLAWAYSLERNHNIVEYRIYRRVDGGGVDYIDYYKSTTNNYFYDNDVQFKKSYYYKVSAVDDAGNEGELSKEVFTTFIPKIAEESIDNTSKDEIYSLSPSLIIVLESKLDIIDQMILDLNKKEEYFKRITGTENIEVVQSLGLLTQVKSAKEKISLIKEELIGLKTKNLTQLEFSDTIDVLLKDAQVEFDKSPQELKIKDSSNYQEFLDEQAIKEMSKTYLITKNNYTDKLFKELVDSSTSIQEKITINVLLIESEVIYPKETINVKTVKKTLNAKETINSVIITEVLPNDLSYNFEGIIFNEKPKIENNLTLFWEESKLTKKTLVYSLIDYPDFTSLKNSKLIVLAFLDNNENVSGITGLAVGDNYEKISPLKIPIIIGIILAGLLGVYYFVSTKKEGTFSSSNPFDNLKNSSLNDENQDSLTGQKMISKTLQSKDNDKLLNIEREDILKMEKFGNSFIDKTDDMDKKVYLDNEIKNYTQENKSFDYKDLNGDPYINNSYTSEVIGETQFSDKEPSTLQISNIYNNMLRYKKEIDSGKEINIEEMQNIKEMLKKIKSICDEIDKASIESYTEKAKKYLRETLRFLESVDISKKEDTKENAYFEKPTLKKSEFGKSFPNEINARRANKFRIKNNEEMIITNKNKGYNRKNNNNNNINNSNSTNNNTFMNNNENNKKNLIKKIDIHQSAEKDKFFSLQNGLVLRSISELIDYLEVIEKDLFFQHVNFSKNDFSNWLREVFEAKELSEQIEKILEPKEMRKKIIESL